MAEVGIALLMLGATYVLSDQENKEKEGYAGAKSSQAQAYIPKNYPSAEKPNTKHDPNVYAQPANQTTDPFFGKDCSTTSGGATFVSLTGEAVDKSKFAHNNCTPYFGARIKGAASSTGERASVLDNMVGTGSQQNTKREVAPLFKPTSGIAWPNGMPSTAEFMLSRQVPSTQMRNIKPWAEEKIAPGLGKPGCQSPVGGGYNTAVQDRNAWLPKTVSELRTTNNPKVTYGLQGHEGAAQSKILQPGTLKTQGAVEKNRPDTTFALGPSRWFTTTGRQIGETHRSEEILQEQDRGVCQTNYFGSGGKTPATYINSHRDNSTNQQLSSLPVGTPAGPATAVDSGNTHRAACTNRYVNEHRTAIGPVAAAVQAAIAPIMDILKPSRKENATGSGRVVGNPASTVGGVPANNRPTRPRTTIKEQTGGLGGGDHLNVQAGSQGAYTSTGVYLPPQHRSSTSTCFTGIAGSGEVQTAADRSHEAARTNNVRKLQTDWTPGGCSSIPGSGRQNVSLADKGNYNTGSNATRFPGISKAISSAPVLQKNNYIVQKQKQTYDHCKTAGRIDPALLSAFKENPYTQSLSSY